MSVINVIKLLDFFLIMHARTLKMLNKKIPVVNISLYAFSGPIYTTTDAMILGKPSSGARFRSSFRRSSANGPKALSFHLKMLLCEWGLASFVSR